MIITRDTPIADVEISVRTHNLLLNHGFTTVGQAIDNVERMRLHAKGWGLKCSREILELKTEIDRHDLLHTPEYLAHRREDTLSTIEALIQDAQRRLTRVAIKGVVSREQRDTIAMQLRTAADRAAELHARGE